MATDTIIWWIKSSKKIINSIGFKFFQTASPIIGTAIFMWTQTINLLPDNMEFFIEHFDRFTILTRKDGLLSKLKQTRTILSHSISLPSDFPYIKSSSVGCANLMAWCSEPRGCASTHDVLLLDAVQLCAGVPARSTVRRDGDEVWVEDG
ncbi:unnamed protein product [Prunus armeniaca]